MKKIILAILFATFYVELQQNWINDTTAKESIPIYLVAGILFLLLMALPSWLRSQANSSDPEVHPLDRNR